MTNHLQPHTASSSNEDFFSSPEWTSITDPSPALTDSLSFEFDSSCDPSPLLTDFNYDENDEEGIHGFASAPLFGPSDQIYGGDFNKSSNDFPLFGDSTSSAPQEAPSSNANGGEGSSPRRAAQLAFSRSLVDNSAPSSGAQSNEDGSNATFALFRALSSTGLQHSGITATAPIENATANPLNISSPPKTILNDFNVPSSSSTSTSTAPAPTPAPAPQVKAVAPTPAQGHGNNTGRRGTKRRLDTSDLLPLDAPIQPRHYKTPSSTSRKPSAGSKAGEEEARAIEIEEAKLQKLTDPHAAKRLSNTLAARRSRHRKAEELRMLNETIENLRGEVEMWKKRCARAEGVSEEDLEMEGGDSE